MVVKRQCSFCANEIEPGTGTLFVKRDGTVFSFCSSSCRKQQLHLGRVGHRLKWTRAHALKVESEQRSAPGRARASSAVPTPPAPSAPPAPAPAATPAPEKATETAAAKAPEPSAPAEPSRPARAPKAKAPAAPKPASSEPDASAEKEKPAKAPRARKPKAKADAAEKTSDA
jgi:large subunit ribosomal protein L24e